MLTCKSFCLVLDPGFLKSPSESILSSRKCTHSDKNLQGNMLNIISLMKHFLNHCWVGRGKFSEKGMVGGGGLIQTKEGWVAGDAHRTKEWDFIGEMVSWSVKMSPKCMYFISVLVVADPFKRQISYQWCILYKGNALNISILGDIQKELNFLECLPIGPMSKSVAPRSDSTQ